MSVSQIASNEISLARFDLGAAILSTLRRRFLPSPLTILTTIAGGANRRFDRGSHASPGRKHLTMPAEPHSRVGHDGIRRGDRRRQHNQQNKKINGMERPACCNRF
jgi:hypothetical protein